MKVIERFVTENPCYKAGNKITVKGLVLHSVGCPQPSAEVFVKQYNNAAAKVCVHAFIDGNTGDVYQTLPWNYRAWHCGGNANNSHIGIEMCEPSCIKYTGGSTFACSDRKKAKKTVMCTLNSAVELFANLCKQYGLNPLEDGVIISHKEGHDRGVASGHGDPDHLFSQLQMNYTMNDFRKAVAAEIGKKTNKKKNVVTPASSDKTSKKTGGIQPGDLVALAPNAVYYSGQEIPDWVLGDKWFVKSVSGDRVVLGKNKIGSQEINSPVDVKFLTVKEKQTQLDEQPLKTQKTQKTPAKQSSELSAKNSEMKISDKGVELIAKYEGCRLEAYKCPAGVWTIGYGHTAGVKSGQKLSSNAAAKKLLKEDLKKYGDYVNECVKKGKIKFKLNQNQFDALTSFCYNCGKGSLETLVSDRTAATVADKLLLYNKAGGKELAGLTKRRQEERTLFLK